MTTQHARPLRLAHYAIRTRDLAASTRFYEVVLGLRAGYRPPFGFPGAWLYAPDDEGADSQGVVHLIAEPAAGARALGAYLGDRATAEGSGAVDHLAFTDGDWPDRRARCEAAGITFVERTVPALGLRQVFLVDPSGVTVELNYPS